MVGWHVQKEQDEACALTKDQIRPKIGLVRRRTHPYLTKHFRVDLKTGQCHKEASLCKLFESWPLWGLRHMAQCTVYRRFRAQLDKIIIIIIIIIITV